MTTADEIINLSAKKNDLRRMHLIHHKPMPSSVTTVLAPVIYTRKTYFFPLFFVPFFSLLLGERFENLENAQLMVVKTFRTMK